MSYWRRLKSTNTPCEGQKFPCTECGGNATVAYVANKDSDWGGKIKKDERLCLVCGAKRLGFNFFGKMESV
jgi:hypothetical protein